MSGGLVFVDVVKSVRCLATRDKISSPFVEEILPHTTATPLRA
jgi:hypothetical protein